VQKHLVEGIKTQPRVNGLCVKPKRSVRRYNKLNAAPELIQRTTSEALQRRYVLHRMSAPKKRVNYCIKDGSGCVYGEGKIGATRCEFDAWVGKVPQPRLIATEATIFPGRIHDHLLRTPRR
jgi:hypothetical protein